MVNSDSYFLISIFFLFYRFFFTLHFGSLLTFIEAAFAFAEGVLHIVQARDLAQLKLVWLVFSPDNVMDILHFLLYI